MRLDEMLGFDENDPLDRLADQLVQEHEGLLRALVRFRVDRGLEQSDVAAAMGIDPSGVSRLESGDRDLRLSTLRRYAFAVGATITHRVESFAAQERQRERMIPTDQLSEPYEWAQVEDVMRAHASAGDRRRAERS